MRDQRNGLLKADGLSVGVRHRFAVDGTAQCSSALLTKPLTGDITLERGGHSVFSAWFKDITAESQRSHTTADDRRGPKRTEEDRKERMSPVSSGFLRISFAISLRFLRLCGEAIALS